MVAVSEAPPDTSTNPGVAGGRSVFSQCAVTTRCIVPERSVFVTQARDLGGVAIMELPKLGLQLRDPRVAIVRHRAHPGCSAPLRDGARIARGGAGGL